MFFQIIGLFFTLVCIRSVNGMEKLPVNFLSGDGGTQSIKSALQKNNSASIEEQAQDQLRKKAWQHAFDTIPSLLQNSTDDAMELLERVTRDVVLHQGCIQEPKAERLYQLAVFFQTGNLLLKLQKSESSIWSVMSRCKQKIDDMKGGFITQGDCRFIELLCKAELMSVEHEDAHCIGKSDTCKKCHNKAQVLVQKTVVNSCCAHFMLLANRYQDSAVCTDCCERLKDFLYLKTKSLIVAARECKVMPVLQKDKDLLKWAICYTSTFKNSQNKKKNRSFY